MATVALGNCLFLGTKPPLTPIGMTGYTSDDANLYTSMYSVGRSLVHGFVADLVAAFGIIAIDTFRRHKV